MDEIKFGWDARKAKQNLAKHKVSFEEATTVFLDENARLIHDPSHSAQEDRFVLLGLSRKLRLLVVCHCYRGKERIIRIISARRADKQEQKQYERFL
ncbi:MAG: BrnT family toxin [Phycisphaerae bacterium]